MVGILVAAIRKRSCLYGGLAVAVAVAVAVWWLGCGCGCMAVWLYGGLAVAVAQGKPDNSSPQEDDKLT